MRAFLFKGPTLSQTGKQDTRLKREAMLLHQLPKLHAVSTLVRCYHEENAVCQLPDREAGGPTWATSSRTWSHTSKYSLASPYTRLYSVCIDCGLVWAFVDCHARLDLKLDIFLS